jgi:hypothetical protein
VLVWRRTVRCLALVVLPATHCNIDNGGCSSGCYFDHLRQSESLQSHSVCSSGGAPYAVSRWSYCLQHPTQSSHPELSGAFRILPLQHALQPQHVLCHISGRAATPFHADGIARSMQHSAPVVNVTSPVSYPATSV